MNKKTSKIVAGLMLGAFIAAAGLVSPIAMAEENNIQQSEQQVLPPADNNQANQHSGHHG